MATYLEYMKAAMGNAQYERTESGAWFASIPGFEGLWATGPTQEAASKDLFDALDGWLTVYTRAGERAPRHRRR